MGKNLKVTGKINLILHDEYGNIKEIREENNTIVGTGLQHIAGRLLSIDQPAPMKYMGLGTSNAVGVGENGVGNTALLSEISGTRTECNVTKTDNQAKVTFQGTFSAGTYTNGAILEAGIFDTQLTTDPGAIMLCRVTFASINKEATDTLSISWTITIS